MSLRDDKLKSLFLNEINNALLNREDLKEITVFTITDVELVDEGKILNVYFSVFNSENKEKIDILMEKFNEITPELKSIIRKRVKTKFVPNIYFKYDETPQKAQRIEEIFKKLETEKNFNENFSSDNK